MQIVSDNQGSPILQFSTKAGHSYSVLGSTDLRSWSTLPFNIPAEGPSALTRTNFAASSIQTIQVQIIQAGPAPEAEFFRLSQQ